MTVFWSAMSVLLINTGSTEPLCWLTNKQDTGQSIKPPTWLNFSWEICPDGQLEAPAESIRASHSDRSLYLFSSVVFLLDFFFCNCPLVISGLLRPLDPSPSCPSWTSSLCSFLSQMQSCPAGQVRNLCLCRYAHRHIYRHTHTHASTHTYACLCVHTLKHKRSQ